MVLMEFIWKYLWPEKAVQVSARQIEIFLRSESSWKLMCNSISLLQINLAMSCISPHFISIVSSRLYKFRVITCILSRRTEWAFIASMMSSRLSSNCWFNESATKVANVQRKKIATLTNKETNEMDGKMPIIEKRSKLCVFVVFFCSSDAFFFICVASKNISGIFL